MDGTIRYVEGNKEELNELQEWLLAYKILTNFCQKAVEEGHTDHEKYLVCFASLSGLTS